MIFITKKKNIYIFNFSAEKTRTIRLLISTYIRVYIEQTLFVDYHQIITLTTFIIYLFNMT